MEKLNLLIEKYEKRISELEEINPDFLNRETSLDSLNDDEKEYCVLKEIVDILKEINGGN